MEVKILSVIFLIVAGPEQFTQKFFKILFNISREFPEIEILNNFLVVPS